MTPDVERMREALVSLDEQAHGETPMRFCQQEPCRGLQLNGVDGVSGCVSRGPAPWNAGAF